MKDILTAFASQSVDREAAWKTAVAQFNRAMELEEKERAKAEEIYAVFQKAARLQKKPEWLPRFLADWRVLEQFLGWVCQKRLGWLERRLSQKLEGASLAQWMEDENCRELSIPWLTPEWFKARARVFIEALKLHKAFITANAKVMRENLWGAIDILQGTVPLETSSESIASAWSSLFCVVPVLSTTFASFSRLFSHIGQEGLGWLLIDEAGQALPQAAVGAIWRARRTVVVGDPMQLKPVIALSLSAQTMLQRHYQTEATWIPGRTSVQELADRVCSMGTMVKHRDTCKWVGMPLRVHRRCERLEFDLANTISYGGLMIFGTPPRPPLTLPRSRWVDIPGTVEHDGHWIPEEGGMAKQLIEKLIREQMPPESIFVVSPFRKVVSHLNELKNNNKKLNIGTIHATQGREAEVVILVLGGNPDKPGAKKWASQEPNLLNVAVTRAKRRFYIIGNQKEWSQYPFFREASELFTPPPSSDGDWEAYEEDLMALLG